MSNEISLSEYTVRKLTQQRIEFFHAENLQNFTTYCQNQSLLCRDLLSQRSLNGITEFYSDARDRKQGVHIRTFGNLYDFGSVFAAYFGRVIPNIYGPIALCFDSSVFQDMQDIVITRQTIAKLPIDWRRSSDVAASKETIDKICTPCSEINCSVDEQWHACELSSSSQSIALQHLKNIIVEPITINGDSLVEIVKMKLTEHNIDKPVLVRQYAFPQKYQILNDLVDYCIRCTKDRDTKLGVNFLPGSVADFSDTMKNRLVLWCRYFIFGTLHELYRGEVWEPDQDFCGICGPGSDGPPALLDWSPYAREETNTPLDYAYCTSCNTLSLRCARCRMIFPMPEQKYNEELSCTCGLKFSLRPGFDRRGEVSLEDLHITPSSRS